jgi:acyl-coenzyme A thioesterase PaaI-like protein
MMKALLEATLNEHFAPWVLALGLEVPADQPADATVLRLPVTPQLARSGGVLCGQAMLAACDTAVVLALTRHFGEFKPCTTVQISTQFLKPLSGQDALVEARLSRVGKTMAFCDLRVLGVDDGKSAATASAVYALLG